ncbi:MAG: methyl-accepting chemotaxis protein, partial [Herbiconiux sp.]|nr:methyl-accepting chemotaxis protein [Herbiconiux sp.]
ALSVLLVWVLLAGPELRSQRDLSALAGRLAEGVFTGADAGGTPTSHIEAALRTVETSSARVIAEMHRMSSAHEAGDIDVTIDTSLFSGGFATMTQGVNEMVGAHIAVKKQAMAVVKAFGEGDFDAPLAQLPGKKAFINDTIEQVRTNLRAVIADMSALSDAATNGELATRADAHAHAGGFRTIVEGVNSTLDAVVEPVREVSRVLVAVEGGDLTSTIESTFRGDLERLRQATNSTVARLAGTVREVLLATDQLASASSQISDASQSMSHAATEQAASVEQTSSSIEEMAASIEMNSANAQTTDGIASKASAEAGEGGSAVEETVEAMKTIAAKIAIIDDIAFQTNMLALNATIEAAR